MRLSPCKFCGLDVMWCVTLRGSKCPVDPEPVPYGGNVEVLDYDVPTPTVRVLRKGEAGDVGTPLHRMHFATCKSPERVAARKRGPNQRPRKDRRKADV